METEEITGNIYDIQGFSIYDGPGVRTTVFLKGCPLRCPWCHSPESQRFDTELNWLRIRCLGLNNCGLCLNACPNRCITPARRSIARDGLVFPEFDKTACNACGLCIKACKATALYQCGKSMTVDEVMKPIECDLTFYKDSGGVTVSGGECLCQPDFTLDLLKRCKALGIHTTVDTTGFVPRDVVLKALLYTDMFLYDLKCMDSALHKHVIGVPNELILDNAVAIAEAGGKLWIRIPVMPQFNDSAAHFDKYSEFLDKVRGAVVLVQLLPYHVMGLSKYDRLLKKQQVFVAEPPSEELMEARKARLEALGFAVRIH